MTTEKKGYLRMKQFYEESEIGHQIAAPLVEGASSTIEFVGDSETYKMYKKNGKTVLEPGAPETSEIYFKFSEGSIDYLFDPPSENVQEYVTRLCDCLLEKDPAKRVEMRLMTNIINGWRKGYIAMLKLGGARAIATVAQLGIRIPLKFLKEDAQKNSNKKNNK